VVADRKAPAAGIALALLCNVASAANAANAAAAARPPMPEPILNETTTDVDGSSPGEFEIETNTSFLRSRVGGAFDLELSAEVEVLLTRRLGLKVEPFFERSAVFGTRTASSPLWAARARDSWGVAGSVSWKIVQDFDHDFYLQAEADARAPTDFSTVVQPGETPQPFALDLRSGVRRGPLTIRNSLGVSAGGGAAAHAPVHGSVALLTGFGGTERFGFWGVEADADGARQSPVLVALDIVPDLAPIGLPFSLGFILPYSVAADGRAPSYGFYVRLFIESAREAAYAKTEAR
jgi:hypothetical protein